MACKGLSKSVLVKTKPTVYPAVCSKRTYAEKKDVVVMKDEPDTQVTHTGQKFEKGDYRFVRFMHAKKVVNPNHAIKLINAIPPEPRKERVVFCDGGGPLGHPKVYINLDKPGPQICGYCGLRFYKEDSH